MIIINKVDKLMANAKPTQKILVKALELNEHKKSHHKLFHFKHHKLKNSKSKNTRKKKSVVKVLELVKAKQYKKLSHKQLRTVILSLAKSRKKLSRRPNTKKFGFTFMYAFKLYINTAKDGQKVLLKKKIHSLLKSYMKVPKSD